MVIRSNKDLFATIQSASRVVECTIGFVKNWIGKNADSREWSTKALEVGVALNDRHCSNIRRGGEGL